MWLVDVSMNTAAGTAATALHSTERQYRPPPLRGDAAQCAVGVDHPGMADYLEHGQVGDRVGVGIAVRQRVSPLLGQLADLGGLGLAVGVELHLAGVVAIGD